jgi:hypothetical protein
MLEVAADLARLVGAHKACETRFCPSVPAEGHLMSDPGGGLSTSARCQESVATRWSPDRSHPVRRRAR